MQGLFYDKSLQVLENKCYDRSMEVYLSSLLEKLFYMRVGHSTDKPIDDQRKG